MDNASITAILYHLSGGLGIIGLIVSISCLVHSIYYKKGWLWSLTIIILPFFGSLLYIFLVIFGEKSEKNRYREIIENRPAEIDYQKQFEELQEKLAETNTIANKTELGFCSLKLAKFDLAEKLFRECLVGNFRNDPQIQYGLALVLYEQGNHQEAAEKLQASLKHNDYVEKLTERRLLLARLYYILKEYEKAKELLQAIYDCQNNPEYFCLKGLLYKELAEDEKSKAFFLTAIRIGQKLSPAQREEFRQALAIAEENLLE